MPDIQEQGGGHVSWPSASTVGNVGVIGLITTVVVAAIAVLWQLDWRIPATFAIVSAGILALAAYMSGGAPEMVRKGGRNDGPSQITERPVSPAPTTVGFGQGKHPKPGQSRPISI